MSTCTQQAVLNIYSKKNIKLNQSKSIIFLSHRYTLMLYINHEGWLIDLYYLTHNICQSKIQQSVR